MRRLNRKVHDAPKTRVGAAKMDHDGAREGLFSHAGEGARKAGGDVHRMAINESFSSHMWRARARRLCGRPPAVRRLASDEVPSGRLNCCILI